MGFFFHKSFRLGPFRLNLSRGGFGFSMSLLGFTLGINARRRPYFRFGRFGFGYHEEL